MMLHVCVCVSVCCALELYTLLAIPWETLGPCGDEALLNSVHLTTPIAKGDARTMGHRTACHTVKMVTSVHYALTMLWCAGCYTMMLCSVDG